MGSTVLARNTERKTPDLVVEVLTHDQVIEFWPLMRNELLRIPDHWNELWTIESLQHALENGVFKVWACGPQMGPNHIQYNLVAFTQEVDFPANRVLRIVLMFGNGMTAAHLDILDASFESYAQGNNIGLIDGMVRFGWLRTLRDRGVKPRGIYLTKRVSREWRQ